jgi:hypothetical protein
MVDFEGLHRLARDARAKGQRIVLLPHADFQGAMETYYGETQGKRAELDRVKAGRFCFNAWGVEFRRALKVVQR